MKKKLGKVGLTNEGPWTPDKPLPELSVVSYEGQMYISFKPSTGVVPGSDDTIWMLTAQRGESLYQMMVRKGLFVDTEDAFLAEYQKVLQDARTEIENCRRVIENVEFVGSGFVENEQQRLVGETAREESEQLRGTNESQRQSAETAREKADRIREQRVNEQVSQMETAVTLCTDATNQAKTQTTATIAATGAANDATKQTEAATQKANAAAAEAAKLAPRVDKIEKDIAIIGAVESLEDTDKVIIDRGGKRYTATAAVLRNYINYGIKVEFIN